MTEIKFKLQMPTVPNFIRIEIPTTGQRQDGFKEAPTVSLGELSDEQLDSIAKDWRIRLFENANRQRKEHKR